LVLAVGGEALAGSSVLASVLGSEVLLVERELWVGGGVEDVSEVPLGAWEHWVPTDDAGHGERGFDAWAELAAEGSPLWGVVY
jgi:hypothetical protein